MSDFQINIEKALGAVTGGVPLLGTATQLAGAYAGYRGTQMTNEMNRDISREQMAHSAEEAAKMRDYQTKERIAKQTYDSMMSNTAVSRRMMDLKRAGINPVLAGKFDASSPVTQAMTGAMGQLPGLPTMQNPYSDAIDSGAKAASSAIQVMKSGHEIEILKQDLNVKQAEESLKYATRAKTIIETSRLDSELEWRKAEASTKYEIWNTWKESIKQLTYKEKQAVFIGIPAGMAALGSFSAFKSLFSLGDVKTTLGRIFKQLSGQKRVKPTDFIK